MIKFNAKNKKRLNFQDALAPAMDVQNEKEASEYLTDYINYLNQFFPNGVNDEGQTPEQVAKINLGYFAGYYDNETRERVEKFFMCSHPVFGAIKINGAPTNEEAFACGSKGKTLNEIRGL